MGLEVELVRQADLVDVTAGIVNFGLDRRWLGELFRDVSRDGFWRCPAVPSSASCATARPASAVSLSPPAHASLNHARVKGLHFNSRELHLRVAVHESQRRRTLLVGVFTCLRTAGGG